MVGVLLIVELQLSICKVGVKNQCKATVMSSMVQHDEMKLTKVGGGDDKNKNKCDACEFFETNQTGDGLTSGRGVTDSGVAIAKEFCCKVGQNGIAKQ